MDLHCVMIGMVGAIGVTALIVLGYCLALSVLGHCLAEIRREYGRPSLAEVVSRSEDERDFQAAKRKWEQDNYQTTSLDEVVKELKIQEGEK